MIGRQRFWFSFPFLSFSFMRACYRKPPLSHRWHCIIARVTSEQWGRLFCVCGGGFFLSLQHTHTRAQTLILSFCHGSFASFSSSPSFCDGSFSLPTPSRLCVRVWMRIPVRFFPLFFGIHVIRRPTLCLQNNNAKIIVFDFLRILFWKHIFYV